MARTVWFQCERPFRPPKDLPCHKQQIGILEISEYRTKNPSLPYGLRIQSKVTWRDEVSGCRTAAMKLAGDLNLIWAYVAGKPLFYKVFLIKRIKSPPGWKGNAVNVERALPRRGAIIEVGPITSRYPGITLPYMPLERALVALRAFETADQATKRLIQLHYDAMEHVGSESALILLSKALELTTAILPGHSRAAKQRALSAEAQSDLRHSLQWLFDIANTRLETRHVVQRGRQDMHPKLSTQERKDFQHDVDIFIRAAICDRLGLDLVTLDG